MKKSNNIYLKNNFYDDALLKYSNAIKDTIELTSIKISVKDCLGYVLSEPVFAKVSSPNFTASAMDGIAVDYNKTLQASEQNHIILTEDIDYIVVDTGDYIPPNYNAVIMVEDLIKVEDNKVKITEPISFFENIRSAGEDIVKTQMILPSYHKIRPVDIGAMIAGGVEYIDVFKPFSIGIMPTGTEIVDISKGTFETGEIIDSNSYMLKAFVEEMGFKAEVNEIVKDDYNLLKQNIENLVSKNDIVFINAGSSAGREDFTKDILEELGEVIVHGISIKPGKPVILAIVNNKMCVGIPGYPVSSYIIFEKVIKPILNNILKVYKTDNILKATLSKRIYSSLKHLEFVRVKVGMVNGKWIATPLARGAGVSMSLVESDGILEIPKEKEGFNLGDEVLVKINKPIDEVKNKIISIGSHDLLLDFMKEGFIKESNFININSTHVGSFSGILSLKNKECTIAPIHILNEKNGEYNVDAVKKFFKNEKMALIKGVKRQQGLIVQKDNPKKINGIEDLKNNKYVNRQKGSGTYVLIDYLLKQNNIDSDEVVGFDFNVPTHFDVAINVKENIADCGLGIYSVANSLDLDFIHITNEDYDFLVYESDLQSENIKQFIKILKSDYIKEQLLNVGGYEIDNIGEIIVID